MNRMRAQKFIRSTDQLFTGKSLQCIGGSSSDENIFNFQVKTKHHGCLLAPTCVLPNCLFRIPQFAAVSHLSETTAQVSHLTPFYTV